ncbi:glycosyltransferase [Streptomyces sp. NBC_01518]|uniref:glycosyltransferase n=1 Tax=Streptomyces sp. NBC_01518 TaxID=2903891 RepID=UPI00386EA4D0
MLLTTVGRRQPGAGKGDAVLALFVSHADVLPHTSVTVTHAGHGTVIASLAHGVPLVALPNPAADQPALAEQIERRGVGIALAGDTATPDHIAAAVHALISDDSYARNARRLAHAISALPGPHGAAAVLERIAGSARPPMGRTNAPLLPSISSAATAPPLAKPLTPVRRRSARSGTRGLPKRSR